MERGAGVGSAEPEDCAGSPHWAARQAFLQGNIGIGIDLFFGGGQYDFNKQAKAGTLVPCGVRERHRNGSRGKACAGGKAGR